MKPKLRKLLGDYEKWYEQMTPDFRQSLLGRMSETMQAGKFGEVGTRNVFHLGSDEIDFNPILADPECFGQPKDIDTEEAFFYLAYRKFCKDEGVEPDGFVDFRYYLKLNLDTPEYDLKVVRARDCQ